MLKSSSFTRNRSSKKEMKGSPLRVKDLAQSKKNAKRIEDIKRITMGTSSITSSDKSSIEETDSINETTDDNRESKITPF